MCNPRYFSSDKDFVLILITIFRSKCCADSKFLESDFTPPRFFLHRNSKDNEVKIIYSEVVYIHMK